MTRRTHREPLFATRAETTCQGQPGASGAGSSHQGRRRVDHAEPANQGRLRAICAESNRKLAARAAQPDTERDWTSTRRSQKEMSKP